MIEEHPQGTLLRIHLQPGAKKTEIAGYYGSALKLKVSSPPVEGKANRALIQFLAQKLGVRRSSLKILAGEKARDKIILILDLDPEKVKRALELP